MVGSLTLFFMPAPLLMKQCYLILTGVVTAYVFTWIPEWTTWVLLVAMALYDIVAGARLACLPGGCRTLRAGRLLWPASVPLRPQLLPRPML